MTRPSPCATSRSRCRRCRVPIGPPRRRPARPADRQERPRLLRQGGGGLADLRRAVLRPLDRQGARTPRSTNCLPRRHPRRDGAELRGREHHARLEEGEVGRQARLAQRRAARTARSTSTSPTSARTSTATPRPIPGRRGFKRYAYLVLDNDYIGFPTPPTESMQVTVAHEYNHILQFNYDVFEDVWLFEDTATWAEEKVYPAINDYLNYLPAFAAKPQVPMTGHEHQDLRRGGLEPLAQLQVRRRPDPERLGGLAVAEALRRRRLQQGDQEPERTTSSFGRGARRVLRRHGRVAVHLGVPGRRRVPGREAVGTVGRAPRRRSSTTPSFRLYDVKPTMRRSVTRQGEGREGHAEHDRPRRAPGRRARRRLPGRRVPAEGRQGHGHRSTTRARSRGSRRSSPTSTAEQAPQQARQADLQVRRLQLQDQPRGAERGVARLRPG